MTMGRKVITNRGKSHQNKAVIEILLLFGVQRYEFISNLQTFTHLFSKNILFSQSQLRQDATHRNSKANKYTITAGRNTNKSKKYVSQHKKKHKKTKTFHTKQQILNINKLHATHYIIYMEAPPL